MGLLPPSIDKSAVTQVRDNSVFRMTEEEFVSWAAVEEATAEWVNGEVIPMSPAGLRHVEITNWLQQVLGLYVHAKKLGRLLGPDFMIRIEHPGISRRIPDLLFVAQSNSHLVKRTHLDGPPDLAIEIVSRDSIARDWREKFLEYEAAGTKEYWIIDPTTETFEASRRGSNGSFVQIALDSEETFRSATVPGFWFKPEWLWQVELPDPIQHLRALAVI